MTLADLLPDLLGRLEELPSDGAVQGPIFWNLIYELFPALVDSMFEASLITGLVQAVNVPITLQPKTTYFSLSAGQGYGFGGFGEGGYGGGSGIPGGVVCALRMKAPWTVRKTSLEALDGVVPNWQNQNPSGGSGYGEGGYGEGGYGGAYQPNQIKAWFPLGVSAFGIWPQLNTETVVNMDFLVSPVNAPRPYSGTLTVPFQEEFTSAFSEYAATMLRTKELGAETEEAQVVFDAYLEKMKQLSIFQNRLDSLVRTPAYGANSGVNRRVIV